MKEAVKVLLKTIIFGLYGYMEEKYVEGLSS